MMDKSRLREINISQGDINSTFIRVGEIINFFPADSIGGPNKNTQLGKTIHIITDAGVSFDTDIDNKKKLRIRSAATIGRFFGNKISDGDKVYIYKISEYKYLLSKTLDFIEKYIGKDTEEKFQPLKKVITEGDYFPTQRDFEIALKRVKERGEIVIDNVLNQIEIAAKEAGHK